MSLDPTQKTYRDGAASSTTLLDQAMHESGAAEKNEKLDWHHNPETLDEARRRNHDEPIELAHKAAEASADWIRKDGIKEAAWKGGEVALKKAGGETLAETVKFLHDPLSPLKDIAQKRALAVAKNAAKVTMGAIGVEGMAVIGAGVATIGVAVRQVQLAEKNRETSDVVAMDLAATSLLDVDVDYKLSVYKHYQGSIAPESVMSKFKNPDGSLTAYGRENLPKLQAACDAGRSAALQAFYCDDVKGFLDSNPKVQERLKNDLAFSKGWDEVMFVKDRPNPSPKLDAIEHGVKARDGWSAADVIPMRG